MARAWIAALVLATGCRQVLGIDDPTVADAPALVTGRVLLRSTHIGADGKVVADQKVYDRADLKLSAWLDDGTFTAVAIDDEGTFSFERASEDQRYRVRVTTPYSEQEYQHTAEHLELSDRLVGRADPNPPTSTTSVKINIPGVGGFGAAYVMSTGVWSMTSVESSPTVQLDWNTVSALPRDLLRADLGDRLYYAHLVAPQANGVPGYLDRLSTNEVTLSNGVPRTFTANTVTALPLDYCAHVTARRATAIARLRAAAPLFANASGSSDYHVYTAPHIEAAVTTQLVLAYGGVGTTDTEGDVHYAAPFPGQTMIGFATALTRTVLSPGDEETRTLAATEVSAEPLDLTSTTCAPKQLEGTAAIAGNPSIAGVTLSADGSQLALLDQPVDVTWNDAVTGRVDYYTVDVQDMGTSALLVRRVVTTSRHAVFERELFKPGGLYVIRIGTAYGQGGATAGDFDTRTSPFGTTSIVSPTFRVGT